MGPEKNKLKTLSYSDTLPNCQPTFRFQMLVVGSVFPLTRQDLEINYNCCARAVQATSSLHDDSNVATTETNK